MTRAVAPLVTALACRSNYVAELPMLAPVVAGLDASSNLVATKDGRPVGTAQYPGVVGMIEDGRLLETPFLSVADDLESEGELLIAGHADGASHRIILPDDDDAGWLPVEALVLAPSARRVGIGFAKFDLEIRKQARSGARSAGYSTCMT
jgi:hypothetical protein